MSPKRKSGASFESGGADSYDVGYRKPPKASRFRPGESGNPRGRPKGTRNFRTDLEEELSEKIEIAEHGHPKKISKQRLVVKALIAKAIKGDTRAASILIGLMAQSVGLGTEEDGSADLAADDKAILERFLGSLAQTTNKKQMTSAADDNAPSA